MDRVCECCNREFNSKAIIEFSGYVTDIMDIQSKKVPKKGRPKVYKCEYCGFVQIFDVDEENLMYRDCVGREVLSREKTMFRLEQFKQFIKKYNLSRSSIIEIGAGRGDYMKIMEKNTAAVYGIENNNKVVNRANKTGLNMIEGYVENKDYFISGAPYSSFYMINYLNTVPNPSDLLRGIYNNLREGAPGFIDVPNLSYLIDNKLTEEFNMFNFGYYTKPTLNNMLALNGFEVLEITTILNDMALHAEVRRCYNTKKTVY